jgi:trehalose 6-phosphate phosphatase
VVQNGRAALFIDVDGTLAAFEKRPELVGPDPVRTALLNRLGAHLDGRVAIVSGRTIEDIDRILEGAVVSAAGVHGLERRRADGQVQRKPPHPALTEAETKLCAFAAAHEGVVVEKKGMSVALHFRGAPQAAADAEALVLRLGRDLGLPVQRGAMVAELRTPGADKGDAIVAFMTESPFNGSKPIMIGDDLTDEAAFEAAGGLGGFGVLVGPPRPTAAHYRLNDVPAVLAFIASIVGPAGDEFPAPRGETACPA